MSRVSSKSKTSSNNIKPLEHQLQVVKFIKQKRAKGIIVFHGVGTGKTITSLLIAKELSESGKKVIITAPVSILGNYTREMKRLKYEFNDNLILKSYTQFINSLKTSKGKNLCDNAILIIDEAHNFGRYSQRSKVLLGCAQKAYKVILLTATPVRNDPLEIVNLYSMITGTSKRDAKYNVTLALTDPEYFARVFDCKVSFFNNIDPSMYPTSKTHFIRLTMSQDYYKEYYRVQENMKEDLPEIYKIAKDLEPFYNGIRRGINKIDTVSDKILWTIDKLNELLSKGKKVLIYSGWKATGISIIEDYLIENGIKYSIITGDIPKENRNADIKSYNNGKHKVMIITSAAAEDIDLKGTNAVIIVEPYWNQAKIDQIIGRAIRYQSHHHLPPEDRHVDIYYLVLQKPKSRIRDDRQSLSADELLLKLSLYKQAQIDEFYKKLEQSSIENNRKCFYIG